MAKMRSIPKAVEEIRAKDPETCISVCVLRRWVKEGKVPTVKTGKTSLSIWTPWRLIWPVEVPPMQIADLLLQGQENAIPLRQLKAMTGRRGRDLRTQIEKEQFVKSMRHRAGEILKSAAAIKRG